MPLRDGAADFLLNLGMIAAQPTSAKMPAWATSTLPAANSPELIIAVDTVPLVALSLLGELPQALDLKSGNASPTPRMSKTGRAARARR